MFAKVLEPVGYMQSVKVLVQGICSYLDGSASAEQTEMVKKNLEDIDQELSATGQGLLEDKEVHSLEDDLAVVYNQLGTAVRAQSDFTKRETEVFLQFVKDYHLERQLIALYNRVMGVSTLADRRSLLQELILSRKPKRWEITQFYVKAVQERAAPEVAAASILSILEKNYDWLHWAVMLHPAFTPLEEEQVMGEEEGEVVTEGTGDKQPSQLLSVASEPPVPHVVACYRETPASLDKSHIHQLIVDLEWKMPNPPPEVYVAIEEDPDRACRYLASRMLRKLQEGLGSGVAVYVVPGRMKMKCNFPPASYYLYEYKHRLASGTVCVFG